jgi:hypothetical protein
MNTYVFNVYTKVKVWRNDCIEVEANSLEDAIEKCKNGEGEYVDCVYDYSDEVPMTINENKGFATYEVYNENSCVFRNTEEPHSMTIKEDDISSKQE